MIDADFAPGFSLGNALKDVRLGLAAAGADGLELPLTQAVAVRWADAASNGHADEDLASVITAARVPRPAVER